MSYLKGIENKEVAEPRTEPAGTKLPKTLFVEFDEYCKKLGIKRSTAIYLLIKREMEEAKREEEMAKSIASREAKLAEDQMAPTGLPVVNKSKSKVNEGKPEVYQQPKVDPPPPPKPKKVVVSASGYHWSKRFVWDPYEVDGEVPCPVCGQWTRDKSNYKKNHLMRHGRGLYKTTQEFLDAHEEKVKQMIEERKAAKGI
jgi:hypothetical protein